LKAEPAYLSEIFLRGPSPIHESRVDLVVAVREEDVEHPASNSENESA
jgi:hypothetical protein